MTQTYGQAYKNEGTEIAVTLDVLVVEERDVGHIL